MKLRGQIAQALRMSIAGMAHSRFDRCHFSSPDSASLDFRTVCQLFTAAPRGHMGIEQQRCLQLYRTTRPAAGIELPASDAAPHRGAGRCAGRPPPPHPSRMGPAFGDHRRP